MSAHPDQCSSILTLAYNNIKAVFPNCTVASTLPVRKALPTRTWDDAYNTHGGKWDVCAFSLYPAVSLVAGLVVNINTLGKRYGKETMLVEVGDALGADKKIDLMILAPEVSLKMALADGHPKTTVLW